MHQIQRCGMIFKRFLNMYFDTISRNISQKRMNIKKPKKIISAKICSLKILRLKFIQLSNHETASLHTKTSVEGNCSYSAFFKNKTYFKFYKPSEKRTSFLKMSTWCFFLGSQRVHAGKRRVGRNIFIIISINIVHAIISNSHTLTEIDN